MDEGMDRFARMFAALASRREGAFAPFVVLGDGGKVSFCEIVAQLVASGADAIELGVVCHDPFHDGPVIAAAHARARAAGIGFDECLDLLGVVRATYPELPICVQTYIDPDQVARARVLFHALARLDVDAVLAVAMSPEVTERMSGHAAEAGLHPVMVCSRDAGEKELSRAARLSRGFVYLAGRDGPTGTGQPMATPDPVTIERLGAAGAAPVIVGFGVSTADHVRTALRAGAAGVVCGSAIAERIEVNLGRHQGMIAALDRYVREMKAATRPVPTNSIPLHRRKL